MQRELVYGLRTCNADGTSHRGFQWPKKGTVTAPDWNPSPVCGGGLHFLPRGQGDAGLLNWGAGATWQVIRTRRWIAIDGDKAKCQTCEIVFSGDRAGAVAYLAEKYPALVIPGGTATAGDQGTATAGDQGTATAGNWGTATAGNWGTATAGYGGTATAGDQGTATAGDQGTATAGNWGTATAGYGGTATAGYKGTATAGNWGTATAGDQGTATAGNWGTATAGYGGIICITCYDGSRRRLVIGYVGENGIKPNTPYHVVKGELQERVRP